MLWRDRDVVGVDRDVGNAQRCSGGSGMLGENEGARGSRGRPVLPNTPRCRPPPAAVTVCIPVGPWSPTASLEKLPPLSSREKGEIPTHVREKEPEPPGTHSPELGGCSPIQAGVVGLGHSGSFPPARGSREPQQVPVGLGMEPSAQWVLYSPRLEPGWPQWERKAQGHQAVPTSPRPARGVT